MFIFIGKNGIFISPSSPGDFALPAILSSLL